jgi:hypothetical protein
MLDNCDSKIIVQRRNFAILSLATAPPCHGAPQLTTGTIFRFSHRVSPPANGFEVRSDQRDAAADDIPFRRGKDDRPRESVHHPNG